MNESWLTDTVKSKFILDLMSKQKCVSDKKKELMKKPLRYESPTARFPRRVLEEMKQNPNKGAPAKKIIRLPDPAEMVPFHEILKGVVAYVDIVINDQDKSTAAKVLLEAMGATVKEKFDSTITHVIYKSGSFATFEKAKLVKAHLLSVLWLEDVRKYLYKVPEKNYPALCTEVYNYSASELFKEYEQVVQEELKQTMQKSQIENELSEEAESIDLENLVIDDSFSENDCSNCAVIDAQSFRQTDSSDIISKSTEISNGDSTVSIENLRIRIGSFKKNDGNRKTSTPQTTLTSEDFSSLRISVGSKRNSKSDSSNNKTSEPLVTNAVLQASVSTKNNFKSAKENKENEEPAPKDADNWTDNRRKYRKLYNVRTGHLQVREEEEKRTAIDNSRNVTMRRKDLPFSTPVAITKKTEAFPKEVKGKTGKEITKEPASKMRATPTRIPPKIAHARPIQPVVPITPQINRRSTLEFKSQTVPRTKPMPKIRTSIVCSRLHRSEVDEFGRIVRQLGGYFVETAVSHSTSHLILGNDGKRTVNLLKAIARGCWILRHEWIHESMSAGKWLPEKEFEVTNFSPAVQECRKLRHVFGPSFSMNIFQDCSPFYVASCTKPPRFDLEALIKLCKGRVVKSPTFAKVAVGERVKYEHVTCVTTDWVLDSISKNVKLPFKDYLLQQ